MRDTLLVSDVNMKVPVEIRRMADMLDLRLMVVLPQKHRHLSSGTYLYYPGKLVEDRDRRGASS